MAKIYFTYFLLLFFVLGCSDFSPSDTAAQLKEKKYFDLAGFLEKEKERIKGNGNFEKTTFVNGETEILNDTEINLEKELAIFSNADINKPAWSDKYQADSTFNERKELVGLHYRTSDEKLRTRHISIDLNENKVSKIQIENKTSTAIANTEQTLIYEPTIGYSIESRQKVQTIDEAVLRIEVKF